MKHIILEKINVEPKELLDPINTLNSLCNVFNIFFNKVILRLGLIQNW